jgi:hypothetical protein
MKVPRIYIPEKRKIQTKTHKMNVLEALEDETLDKYNSPPA